jgi:hypothetical protein
MISTRPRSTPVGGRFAANGDPGGPAYDLQDRSTMRLGPRPRVINDPRAQARRAWEGVW